MISELFHIEPTPRKGRYYGAVVKALKAKHGIWTHRGEGANGRDWLALSVPKCHAALSGFALTAEEKQSPVAMLAGWSTYLEDKGLVHEGYATELEAVKAACGL